MTQDEFKQLVRNSSGDFRKAAAADLARIGCDPLFQKPKDDHCQGSPGTAAEVSDADHQAGTAKTNAGDHRQFGVSIVVRVSDRRRRDLDGILSTLMDCLTRVRGRLSHPSSKDNHSGGAMRARARRRRDNDHTTLNPPF